MTMTWFKPQKTFFCVKCKQVVYWNDFQGWGIQGDRRCPQSMEKYQGCPAARKWQKLKYEQNSNDQRTTLVKPDKE